MTERLIVIGNGMAGLRLLDELCRLAPERYEVTVIGAEPVPAYNRILLSALLAGDVRRADLEYHPAAWYAGRGLRLKLGVPVTAVSARARQVITADGETLPFDRLVLATGSEALRPPIDGMDLEAVLTFRDLGDVAGMEALLPSCRRAVVIGGGLLGLEAAYGLAKRGLAVTVVHLMDRLMERQLDGPAARPAPAQPGGTGHLGPAQRADDARARPRAGRGRAARGRRDPPGGPRGRRRRHQAPDGPG